MRIFLINTCALLLAVHGLPDHASHQVPAKDHDLNSYFAVESSLGFQELLDLHPDWNFEHNVRSLEHHYVFSVPKSQNHSVYKRDLLSLEHIDFVEELPLKRLHKKAPIPVDTQPLTDDQAIAVKYFQDTVMSFEIQDPLFSKQWHIINTRSPGNDLNVVPVWEKGITGKGVTVAIVDDGLDYESPDLQDNFSAEGSWDYNDNTNLPKPRLSDDYHGTRCAGEIAAGRNDFCGVGVAYNAKVSGIRILSKELTAEDEAASLTYASQINDIYSCSWGPPDNGHEMEAPSELVKRAILKGVTEGRNNKGSVYVFASGNGALYGDNCNFDGYTNSIYSITVGAIDFQGLHSPYSESCSAVLTVTYSSGSGEFIHSTDINNKCSDKHGGTSAAAPMAAGIYALVLEANPNLTWRDVQYLTIMSGVEINEEDGEWQAPNNKFGKRYSHMYGFGKLNADMIVELAKTWENVNAQVSKVFPTVNVNETAATLEDTVESSLDITREDMGEFDLKRVEHVTVTVNMDATQRGFVNLELISPDGTVSKLAVERKVDRRKTGFPSWTFMSVANWGEDGVGEWRLRAKTTRDINELTLKDWTLSIFGEARDQVDPIEENTSTTTASEPQPSTSEVAPEVSTSTQETESLTSTEAPSPTQSDSPSTTLSEPDVAASSSASDHHENALITTAEKHYFIFLVVSGAVLIVGYYLLFKHSRKKFHRLRAETFEFDIIDSDSEYEVSTNPAQHNAAQGDEEVEDYDFDLSDVEDVPDNGEAEVPGSKETPPEPSKSSDTASLHDETNPFINK